MGLYALYTQNANPTRYAASSIPSISRIVLVAWERPAVALDGSRGRGCFFPVPQGNQVRAGSAPLEWKQGNPRYSPWVEPPFP